MAVGTSASWVVGRDHTAGHLCFRVTPQPRNRGTRKNSLQAMQRAVVLLGPGGALPATPWARHVCSLRSPNLALDWAPWPQPASAEATVVRPSPSPFCRWREPMPCHCGRRVSSPVSVCVCPLPGGTPVSLPSSLSPQSSLPTARALTTPPKLHTCEKCGITIA